MPGWVYACTTSTLFRLPKKAWCPFRAHRIHDHVRQAAARKTLDIKPLPEIMVPQLSLTEKEATLQRLLLDVSQYVHEIEQIAKPQLRFTGGWVRDKLLGVESKDVDVGIDSMTGLKFGLAMKRFLADENRTANYDRNIVRRIAKIEANPEKSKHLETATTNVLGLDVDLVNLRKETYSQESRNPQIEPATPEEDALRRDLTVNALFYNLQTEEIEDLTGRGLQDLRLKIIRTPLEPFQTFEDDPLRVLRSIRFASRLGYSIDPAALKCMGDKRITDALKIKISRERVGMEVEKMLRGMKSGIILRGKTILILYRSRSTHGAGVD